MSEFAVGEERKPTRESWISMNRKSRVGGNPVILEGSADPSVKVIGGSVYIYPSHDFSKESDPWVMHDWKVYSTDDLVNFTDHGVALRGVDVPWATMTDRCFAPDCIEKNGKFYFYFPMVHKGAKGEGGAIGVAVGDSPEGPFEQVMAQPLVGTKDKPEDFSEAFFNIDPVAFTDEYGRSYLIWGNGACFIAELNEDMVSFKSLIKRVRIDKHQGYAEGPFVWKVGDTYYMLYSQGGGKSYDRLDYATSGSVWGPYEFRGTIVAHGLKGNIHGSAFEFKGQWYVAYHDLYPTDKYRMTHIDRMFYREDGSIATVTASRIGVGWHNAVDPVPGVEYFEKSPEAFYARREEEDVFYMRGLKDGQWLKYPNVKMPFYFQGKLTARFAQSGGEGRLLFYKQDKSSELVAAIELSASSKGNDWSEVNVETNGLSLASYDIFVVIEGDKDLQVDLDWFQFF